MMNDLDRAKKLWDLLDDIDTAYDMFHSENREIDKYIHRKLKERYKILTSDGYVLAYPDDYLREIEEEER